MRVVGVVEFGGPEKLRVFEVPRPEVREGQVLVRVRAATVNPTDTLVRVGQRHPGDRADEPQVPGMDLAGEVVEVGPGTQTDLAVGDRVVGILFPRRSRGAYSEYVALASDAVVRAPAGTTHVEAATLTMNALTARLTLDRLGLRPGQVLGVTGAAGAYGGFLVQLARAEGLVVVADASERDEDLVRGLGAHHVVRRGDDVAGRIRQVVPGGVDALADGAVQDGLVVPAVRDGGAIATTRGWSAEDLPRGITTEVIWITDYLHERTRMQQLVRQVEEGVLTLRVAASFPAEEAAEAHRRLEAGGTRGRLVLEL